jgi:hypothetical protein
MTYDRENIYATKLINKVDLNKQSTLLSNFKKNITNAGKTMTDNISFSKSRNKEIFVENTFMPDDDIRKNYMTQIKTTIDSEKNKRKVTPTGSHDFNLYKAKIVDKINLNKKNSYTQSGTSLNNMTASYSGNFKTPVAASQGIVKNLKDELKSFIQQKNKIDPKKINLKK